jgi:hypothetical protein
VQRYRAKKRSAPPETSEGGASNQLVAQGTPEEDEATRREEDAAVDGAETRRASRWRNPGDREFGSSMARVFENINVQDVWVEAARYASKPAHTCKEKDTDTVVREKPHTWVYANGKWASWGKASGRSDGPYHVANLKILERILRFYARKHYAVANKTPIELHTFFVGEYRGGPVQDVLVKPHIDVVTDSSGKDDPRPVVSVVFVLEGGFQQSGLDVCVHDDDGTKYFPHLETGDILTLKGGPCGVVHDVGFYGNPKRAQWDKRYTVVGVYAIGGSPKKTVGAAA